MSIAFMSQRNSGFTFFEMLIVITVLFVIVTLIPMIMKQAINNVKFDVVSDQEVTVFFQYLARDMREAKQYELDGNAILLKKGNQDEIRYQIWNKSQIRRTVNGLGHVLMLEGVQAFLCEQEDLLMRCHIELQNGRLFDRTMIQMEESAKQNE